MVPIYIARTIGVAVSEDESQQLQRQHHQQQTVSPHHALRHKLEHQMLLSKDLDTAALRSLTARVLNNQTRVHPNWIVKGRYVALVDGSVRKMDWPLARVVATQYSRTKVAELRDLLLALLQRGLDPATATPWSEYFLPVTAELLWAWSSDAELGAALIDASAKLPAFRLPCVSCWPMVMIVQTYCRDDAFLCCTLAMVVFW